MSEPKIEKRWKLSFHGVQAGFKKKDVEQKLALLFKVDIAVAQTLLSKPCIAKKGLEKNQARRLKVILDSIGVAHRFSSSILPESVDTVISSTLKSYIPKGIDLFADCSEKQTKNALVYCAVPTSSHPVAIIDCSLTSNCKRSIVVSREGVFWSKAFNIKSSVHFISWADISGSSAGYPKADKTKIEFSKHVQLSTIGSVVSEKLLLEALLDIADRLVGAGVKPAERPEQTEALSIRDRLERRDQWVRRGLGIPFGTLGLLVVVAIATPADKGPFSDPQICRAAIGAIMARDPYIISTDYVEGKVVYTSYHRPDDGTLWQNKCKLEGHTVLWGRASGRWRLHPDDPKISFRVKGDTLSITERFTSGSRRTKRYTYSQLE